MTAVLRCEALRGGYGDSHVLHELNLQINEGDTYALIGKNGAGKSTFLRTVVGLLPIFEGTIELFGRDITELPTYQIVGSGVAYAPQERAFFADLSVWENLRLGSLSLTDKQFDDSLRRVKNAFPFIGGRLRQKAGTLSGGEQAIVKVARALLPNARLVLLDEISEGLQPSVIDRVVQALSHEVARRTFTIIFVEQNVDFVMRVARRYGLIERGQIIAEGLMSEPDAASRIGSHLSI
jgi:branched-chain amino acid transport system ATP-binding protein